MTKATSTSRILIDNETEHAELMTLLAELQQTLHSRHVRVEDIAKLLGVLRTDLEAHFAQEEVGGFFREAVERQPWLFERIEKLRLDHHWMREAAAALVDAAEHPQPALAWWPDVERRFQELAERLKRHERLEIDLLQEAWTDDMGTKD